MQKTNRREALQRVGASLAWPLLAGVTATAGQLPPRIKIGQIGVGHGHALANLVAFRSSTDYEVVGLVEADESLRKAAEAEAGYRGLPWLTREQLLNVPGLQAVLVETRVRDLLDTADACITAGKHIYLDKPAGESLPHFRHILEEAARRKLLVQMGYMYRYSPAVLLLHEFLRQGWLGDVFEVHTVMSKVVPVPDRLELAEHPGGMMFELGCHIIDLVVGVLGKPTKINAYPRHSAAIDDTLADNMLAVFEYPRAIATVKTGAIEIAGGERRHFVVCGTEGTFHIQPLDNPRASIALSQPRGIYKAGYQDVTFPKFERRIADAIDMARIIRGEQAATFTYEHDAIVQDAVLQACGL